MRKLFTNLSGVLLVFFLFIHTAIAQQSLTVRGTVSDAATGEALIGVSVKLKGTTQGTSTDATGAFSMRAPSNATLVITYIGYQTREVPINNQTNLTIKLSSSAKELEQVVVVGYGTQRRSQVVGSVGSVKGAEITKQPVLTAAQGLQGKTSGVQITATGQPGSQPQVRIRGINSITGDPNPIYVVDGVITTDVRNISSSDIQSIEVLKDASSQAIYGSRAGNGVILITTKAGRAGKMTVNLNTYGGFRTYTSKVDMADAKTYAAYTNEALAYDNNAALFDLNNLPYNTDWFDEITRKGAVQNYDVNISGGTEKTTYYFSAGLFKDNGIVKGQDYTRGNVRLNNEYRLTKYLKLGHNLTLTYDKWNNKPNEFADAYRMAPTVPVRNADGSYGYLQQLSVANPIAALDYTNDSKNQVRLQGNAFAELTPIKGLTLRSSFNFNRYDNNQLIYTPVYSVFSGQENKISNLNNLKNNDFYYIINNQATYNKTIDKHELNVTAGYTAERDRFNKFQVSVKDVPAQKNLWYINQGDPNTLTYNADDNGGSLTRRASAFGRLTYTYDRRYNISGVIRRDGSSNFPEGQKWGTFYSVGASWIISEESFMKNQEIFNDLKLRAGYGKVGNDNVSTNLSVLNGVSQSGNYSFGGDSYPVVTGITFNQIKDAKATWEPTEGIDAGLEFSTLKARLSGEVSYYNKKTDAYVNVTYPSTLGDVDNTVYSRAATVRNKGVEFNLNWRDRASADFNYHVGFNITFNKNNVDKVTGNLQLKDGSLGNGEIVTYTVVGQPIGSFWVYNATGIYKTQAEVDATPHITGAQPGDLIYADTNGDGVINDNDRIFVGSYQPKTYYGFNAGFEYKQFDFSIDCYGNAGNKIYNGKKAVRLGNDNIELDRASNRWSPSNPNGTEPRASNAIPKPSTYYVESGNFFRVNNITLGYTVPASKLKIGDSQLRFYATAQNPFIIKSYSGYTPELPGSRATDAGIELNIYPVFTTYMFGVNFSF